MCFTFSLVLVGSFFYLRLQTKPVLTRIFEIPDPHLTTITFISPDKPVIPPTVRPVLSRTISGIPDTPPIITRDNQVSQIPTLEELSESAIGTKLSAGDPESGIPEGNGGQQAGRLTAPVSDPVVKEEVLNVAEWMPEFPGGTDALKRFLLRNLHMPENSLEPGTRVQVVARFVVGADGRVRDIEITGPADAIFNLEVKRVIARMPDWKPGEQQHRKVAVYFSLPVNFLIAE